MSDIAAFDECYFGADHTGQVTVTSVDGGPGTGPGSAEAALDIEDVSALAPGAKIHVFQAPNMNGMFSALDTANAIAVADDASQVSTSWGLCEAALQQGAPGAQQVENEIFEQMAAQGQTVFAAAGDDGSDCLRLPRTRRPWRPTCRSIDPASQPYVTSVGGTTVTSASRAAAETVWNNGNNGGAGGGGISATWAMPPWQDAVAVPQSTANRACSNDPSGTADNFHVAGLATTLPAGTACRETPDVSALADPQTGPTIFYDGSWAQYRRHVVGRADVGRDARRDQRLRAGARPGARRRLRRSAALPGRVRLCRRLRGRVQRRHQRATTTTSASATGVDVPGCHGLRPGHRARHAARHQRQRRPGARGAAVRGGHGEPGARSRW